MPASRDLLKKLKSARKSLDKIITVLELSLAHKVQENDLESAKRLAVGWANEDKKGVNVDEFWPGDQ